MYFKSFHIRTLKLFSPLCPWPFYFRYRYFWFYRYNSTSGVPRNFFRGGGSINSVEDRDNGDLGMVAPYSGVLEAAVIWYKKFHFIYQKFLNLWYFRLFMMTTNLFVIFNVKQL